MAVDVQAPAGAHVADPTRQRVEDGDRAKQFGKPTEIALLGVFAGLQLAWMGLLLYGIVEVKQMIGL